MPSASTDIQAEVLVPDPIPLESIIGIAVRNDDQAQREICRLDLQGIALNKPIHIVPEFYNRATLSRLIQGRRRATEILYTDGGQHGR